jgi:hypothetical protein
MVLLICPFLFYQQRSAEQRALEKDYVSCLSITNRHTAPWSGAEAFALFRCRRRDGKRPPRRRGEAARRATIVESADS